MFLCINIYTYIYIYIFVYIYMHLFKYIYIYSKCMNKRCGVYNMITEGKSYIFEHSKTAFIININLSSNTKNVVNIIKCCNCKKYSLNQLKYYATECPYIRATLIYQKTENSRFHNILMNVVMECLKCQYTKLTTPHYFK